MRGDSILYRIGYARLAATVFLVFLVIALILGFIAGKKPASEEPEKLKVVASFYPLYFFAKEIGGGHAEVSVLIPPGSEPHTFRLTPQDILRVSQAKIFIYNGGGFEPWIEELLEKEKKTRSDLIVVDTSRGINTSKGDPHFWLDPLSAKIQVANMLEAFIQADPANATYYKTRAKKLTRRLEKLDRDYRDGLKNRRKNVIVTTHKGFDYLASRYGFKAEAIMGITADAEPSIQDLIRITETVRENNLKYVFAEPVYSDKFIEIISRETGAKVLILDGVHSQLGPHANMDYFQIMYENLENLKKGLEAK